MVGMSRSILWLWLLRPCISWHGAVHTSSGDLSGIHLISLRRRHVLWWTWLSAVWIRVRTHGAIVDHVLLSLFDRRAEILFHIQFRTNGEALKAGIAHGTTQDLVLDVVHLVVRDQMVRNAINVDAHGLLDEAIRSEAVRIDERAYQLAFELSVNLADSTTIECAGALCGWLGRRRCGWHGDLCGVFVTIFRFGRILRGSLTLHRSLLLTRWKGLLELSVDEKVAEDTTG